MRPLDALRAAHGDRLDVLAAEHGPAAAAAGVPAVVRDRRVADGTLAGGPDRRDPVVGAEPRAQLFFRHRTRLAAHVIGRLEPYLAIVDHEHRQPRRTADDDDGVAAGALAGNGKAAARE